MRSAKHVAERWSVMRLTQPVIFPFRNVVTTQNDKSASLESSFHRLYIKFKNTVNKRQKKNKKIRRDQLVSLIYLNTVEFF
jgi:hypothetical protein